MSTWEERQALLNRFTSKYVRGVGPLEVDGELGPLTRDRIRDAKWWLGWNERSSDWSAKLERALAHPYDWRNTSRGTVARGVMRRGRHDLSWLRSHFRAGVTTYDGVRVAAWLVPYLEWARRHGWKGRVLSGYREPAESERLCYAMCGAPRCPGRCAGRSSNHSGSDPPSGAVDVSDYAAFARVIARCPYRPQIFNALGAQDPGHFSVSGR